MMRQPEPCGGARVSVSTCPSKCLLARKGAHNGWQTSTGCEDIR